MTLTPMDNLDNKDTTALTAVSPKILIGIHDMSELLTAKETVPIDKSGTLVSNEPALPLEVKQTGSNGGDPGGVQKSFLLVLEPALTGTVPAPVAHPTMAGDSDYLLSSLSG